MKQPTDAATIDMIGGIPAKRGRKPVYADTAARVAAYRARNQLQVLHVELPRELIEQFEEFLKFKDITKREVIEKLLRTQLLRKR